EGRAAVGGAAELDGLTALAGGDLHDAEVRGRVGLLIAVQVGLGGRIGSARAQADRERRSECCSGDAPGAATGTGRRGHAGNRTRESYGRSETAAVPDGLQAAPRSIPDAAGSA